MVAYRSPDRTFGLADKRLSHLGRTSVTAGFANLRFDTVTSCTTS